MSIPKKITINCPNCAKEMEATIFQSLNTDFAPDVIETVICGDRFQAVCPHCGFVAHLEYDLLYHDIQHGAMIWVVHTSDQNYAEKVAEVRDSYLIPYDVTRIVEDMTALSEKAACLASGKDDRIVELCKVFLTNQLRRLEPEFHLHDVFYTNHDGKDLVYFHDINGQGFEHDLDSSLYEMISDRFQKPLSQLEKTPYQIIDRDWAVDLFRTLPDDHACGSHPL